MDATLHSTFHVRKSSRVLIYVFHTNWRPIFENVTEIRISECVCVMPTAQEFKCLTNTYWGGVRDLYLSLHILNQNQEVNYI